LLLDRSDFPRDKTCGDGLTPRALRVLDQMGILADVSMHGCTVSTYEIVAPNGHTTAAPITTEHAALVVPRMKLDQTVLRRAIASGARFESRVSVNRVEPISNGARVYAEDGRSFDGRVAVVATGAATAVLKRSGILRHQPRSMLAARAYFEELQHEVARSFQLRFDGAPLPGYGWVFPVGRNAANVGVGFLPKRHLGTARGAFERFVAGHAMRSLLEGAHQVGPVKGYPIRVDFLRSPTFARRTLMVGEAAGLVNPLTGEGIDYALESGQIAAEFLARRFTADDTLTEDFDEYHVLLRSRFEKIFRFSEWIRTWYGKPPLLNLLVPLANRRPELRQLLANIVLGEREPRGYPPLTMLARLLVYLVRTHPRSFLP
jgi:geranylgeranyl reductase family protein